LGRAVGDEKEVDNDRINSTINDSVVFPRRGHLHFRGLYDPEKRG
jgi:hypothetical protein